MKLILLRHGESQWNRENRFTRWTDVDLTEKGITESKNSGFLLKKHNFVFLPSVYVSPQKSNQDNGLLIK